MSFDSINSQYAGLSNEVKEAYLKAAHVLPFTGLEIKAAFSETEIKEVNQFIADMNAAAADNTKKADAIARYAGVVKKLLGLAGVPV